jgi:hypothetical protein
MIEKNNFVPAKNKPSTQYNSLSTEIRSHVETACAAFHLNRKPQTLRSWASLENGPIFPTRINGRLSWPVEELKILLSAENRC